METLINNTNNEATVNQTPAQKRAATLARKRAAELEAANETELKAVAKEQSKAAAKQRRIDAGIAERNTIAAAKTEAVNSPLLLNTDGVKPTEKVTFKMVVTQVGKNPFSFELENKATLSQVEFMGLARKTGYAVAGHLLHLAESAIAKRERNGGKWVTAFNPKSVFKIEVFINAKICFYALNSKGLDAIRLMDSKGVINRNTLVDKFELIAEQIKAIADFTEAMQFANSIDTLLKDAELIEA